MEKVKNIINSETLGKAFYNLYDRWRDECKYEDINEYGKAILNVINKHFPQYGVTLISSTSRPFGVKLQVGDKKVHVFVKISGSYLQLCAKLI